MVFHPVLIQFLDFICRLYTVCDHSLCTLKFKLPLDDILHFGICFTRKKIARVNSVVKSDENSRVPKTQFGQGWQIPSGMAKTVYERENCDNDLPLGNFKPPELRRSFIQRVDLR